jgi:hypothetical protein
VTSRARTYGLYGLSLRSSLALPCPRRATRSGDVELVPWEVTRDGPPPAGRSRAWFGWRCGADGSALLSWKGLFDFAVSADGRRIAWRRAHGASDEALHTYLLAQVVSFSLLALGREPLHATVVTLDDGAIALVGDCGSGKSTLAAAFLAAGHRLLTDDLLVLDRRDGTYWGLPGLPRIKLYSRVAGQLLGMTARAPRMNPGTGKRVIQLAARSVAQRAMPVRAIYVLRPRLRAGGARAPGIEPLARSDALLEIVRATFNTMVVDRARLARQFRFARDVAARIPVKRLDVPRGLSLLPAVRRAVLNDLAGVA